MALKSSQRQYFKIFGGFVQKYLRPEKYEEPLRKAQMTIRPEAFLAEQLATTILTFFGFLFFVAFAQILILPRVAPSIPLLATIGPLLWMLPLVFALIVWVLGTSNPSSKARKRSKEINLRLPYALNYVAAMASAGVIPTEIFQSLS